MLLLLTVFILAVCSFWLTHRTTTIEHAENARIDMRTWFQNGGGGKPKAGAATEGAGSSKDPGGKPGVMILLDEDETEDRALRAATDTMDAGALRRAINEAQEAGHDSTALRTAKFVLQHLTDTRSLPGPKNPLELPPPIVPSGTKVPAPAMGSDSIAVPPAKQRTEAPVDGLRAPGAAAAAAAAVGANPSGSASPDSSSSSKLLGDGSTPADDEADDLPPEPTTPGGKRLPMIHEGSPQLFESWTSPASVPESLAPLLPPPQYSTIFHAIPPEIESPRQAAQRFEEIIALGDPRFHPRNFPIGVVAYNRPALLRQCLESLLTTPGVTLEQVTVYQDGEDAAVAQEARDLGVRVSQHKGNANQPGQEGAMQIARHYLWVLRSLFADNPSAAFGIVVEDDMIFSPDFMLYFTQMAPVYERDPTVYAISSWNDNAQSRVTSIDPATGKPRADPLSQSVHAPVSGAAVLGASSPSASSSSAAAAAATPSLDPSFTALALDPRMTLRTDFFIGLGWMISRQLFEKELQPKWPPTHWDHWMRDPLQRRNRQTIYPEVARNYNTGRKGTHSDEGFYRKYFEGIVWNKQAAVWMGAATTRLIAGAYEPWLLSRLHAASQISSTTQFAQYTYTDLVLFLDMHGPDDPRWEKSYAPYFGLFHSQPFIRGIYKDSVVYTRWRTNYLFLVFSGGSETFAKVRKEASTKILGPSAFQNEGSSGEIRVHRAIPRSIDGVSNAVTKPGASSPLPVLGSVSESCTDVCRRRTYRRGRKANAPELVCTVAALARINDCDSMQKHFPCAKCEGNWGTDQPAYVHNPARKQTHAHRRSDATRGAQSSRAGADMRMK